MKRFKSERTNKRINGSFKWACCVIRFKINYLFCDLKGKGGREREGERDDFGNIEFVG